MSQRKMIANKKSCKHKIFFIVICLLLMFILWVVWGNTALEVNTYIITSENLSESFRGYRIAHISDLHNAEFGTDNEKLLQEIKETKPDMIAITGDLVDSYHTDIQVGLDFARQAVEIAPTYYVTGNHEARISQFDELKKGLSEIGVIVLENEAVEVEKNGESILLLGVDDPSFQTDYLFGDATTVMDSFLKICKQNHVLETKENQGVSVVPENTVSQEDFQNDKYTLLLSHRPELFEVYVANGMDLVLSGHAHGGQFRFPFVGGILAPNQGFFPTYDAGLYIEETTHMIVSRGIGNSLFPFRINNRPEVILILLEN